MKIVPLDDKWKDLLDENWIIQLDQTAFLSRCRNQTVTRQELEGFVRQQYFYSRHFTRFLCALLSNIANDSDRQELCQNLFEEMGLGGLGNIPHAQIYKEMMEKMGVEPEADSVYSSTRNLIDSMIDCCRNPNPMVGLGALCLGAEAIVPHVYSQIVNGFEGIGETAENLSFFHIHIEGDDDHAVTMRNIIERELQANPQQRLILRNTALRVLMARTVFFEGFDMKARYVQPSKGVYYESLHV